MKLKKDDRLLQFASILFVTFLCITILMPLLHMIATSLSSETAYVKGRVTFFPIEININAYRELFYGNKVINMLKNSIFVTVVGTFLSVIVTTMFAYPASKSKLPYMSGIMFILYVSMMLNPGIVPFALFVKNIGLSDSLWSLILPSLVVPWNVILLKNFFSAIPQELEESAKIEGCNEPQVFFKILIPLAKPGIISIALFYSLAKWNEWFYALIFNGKDKWTIQLLIREVLTFNGLGEIQQSGMLLSGGLPPAETMKMAIVLVAAVPIMCFYPFMQKYFVEGITMGAVKG